MSLLPPAVRAGRYAPLNFCQCFFYCGAMVQKVFGKNTNFCFFQKIENLWKCFAKISVTKFRKWKIWDCYLVRFSALIVVVYSVFSVDAFFTEKIAKQNRLFWLFWKKPEKVILFCNFLHEKCIDRKNKVHHDEEHEKTRTMVVFIFSIDPQKGV